MAIVPPSKGGHPAIPSELQALIRRVAAENPRWGQKRIQEVGGELLTVEGVMTPGKGKTTIAGNLFDVMKESISAAPSYVRSRAVDFGIDPSLFDRRDIHVHVPEGETLKDGPSAGVAMATAIVSVTTGIPARHDVAMTAILRCAAGCDRSTVSRRSCSPP